MKLLSKTKIYKKREDSEGGFTLIELLVVIGILAILLAITLIAINPNKHFEDVRNTQRSSNVSAILDGIYEYESANSGNIPPTIASAEVSGAIATTELGGGVGQVDVCADIVPTYLAALPMDPKTATGTQCSGTYDTGYTIALANGRFTISAPAAEDGATISVTR